MSFSIGLVRFGTRLMKNPHTDKNFFHFFEKNLNGQAKDLSLSGSTESVCSEYRAVCLEIFHGFFRGGTYGGLEAGIKPERGCLVAGPFMAGYRRMNGDFGRMPGIIVSTLTISRPT